MIKILIKERLYGAQLLQNKQAAQLIRGGSGEDEEEDHYEDEPFEEKEI